jgi:hypothetical protein
MRLSNAQAVARPNPYDRNGTAKTSTALTGGAAPHAITQRWSYTVPVGRKAFIEAFFALVQRNTAAAPVGAAAVIMQYTPVGGAATRVLDVWVSSNGVGDTALQTPTNFGFMQAGDVLTASDQDSSTGGTVTYVQTAKYTEFDA